MSKLEIHNIYNGCLSFLTNGSVASDFKHLQLQEIRLIASIMTSTYISGFNKRIEGLMELQESVEKLINLLESQM